MKVTPQLLEKYTEGLCSIEEKRAVEKWLSNSEAELSFPDENDLPLHKATIWQRVEEDAFAYQDEIKPKRLTLFRKPWLVAACVLLTCGFSFFLFKTKPENQALPAKHSRY